MPVVTEAPKCSPRAECAPDAGDRVPYEGGHGLAGALGVVPEAAVPAAQSGRAREFAHERAALDAAPLGAVQVMAFTGLVDLGLELGEPARQRICAHHSASIALDRDQRPLAAFQRLKGTTGAIRAHGTRTEHGRQS